jgi:glutathione S-transferase
LIAEYLDATYPDTPKLFPPGTAPLQHAFIDTQMDVLANLWPFTVVKSYQILNPRSKAHHRGNMEAYFKLSKLEDILPEDSKEREVLWAKARASFEKVDAWYQKGKDEGPYLLGNTICFADFAFASFASWPKRLYGEDSVEWQDMRTWSEGRLGALVDSFARYETMM